MSEQTIGIRIKADGSGFVGEARQVTAEIDRIEKATVKTRTEGDRFISSLKEEAQALGKTRSQLLELKAAQLGVADSARPMIAAMREHETSSGFVSRLAGAFTALAATIAITVAAIVALAAPLIDAQIHAEKLRTTLSFASGNDLARTAESYAYISGMTQRLGLDFRSTADSYAKFAAATRGSSLEGQAARDVFEGVARASAAMGLSSEESGRALLALTQMISKGRITAEDWRGQLAEALPIANQTMATSLGVTTSELARMLDQGELTISMLQKFSLQLKADTVEAANAAADGMQAATNRMASAWEQLKQGIADSGVGDTIKGQMNIATDAMNDFTASIAQAKREGSGFFGQAWAGTKAAGRFANPINAFSYTPQSGEAGMKYLLEQRRNLQLGSKGDASGNRAEQLRQLNMDIAKFSAKFPELASMAGTSSAGPTATTAADQLAGWSRESSQRREENKKGWDTYYATVENRAEKHARKLKDLDEKAAQYGIGKDSAEYKQAVANIDKEFEAKQTKASRQAENAYNDLLKRLQSGKLAADQGLDYAQRGQDPKTQRNQDELNRFLKADNRADGLSKSQVANLRAEATAADAAEQALRDYQFTIKSGLDLAADVDRAKDREAALNARWGDSLADADRQVQDQNQALREQIALMGVHGLARERQIALNRLDNRVRDVERAPGSTTEQIEEARTLAARNREEINSTFDDLGTAQGNGLAGWKAGWGEYVSAAQDAYSQMKDFGRNTFNTLGDAAAEWTTTGKLNVRDMARSILGDLSKIAAQKAMVAIAGSFFANGGAFGASAGDVKPFANGGTFSNQIYSSPTLFKFAQGGRFNLGVMGEAGDEAVMPLTRGPGGRLGVAMYGGAGGSGDQVYVSITVNAETGETTQSGSAGDWEAMTQRMSKDMRSIAREEIALRERNKAAGIRG
ncbi:hypothetical protein IGB42_02630 [Andreprevotia sp. IGB-42]|uniref:tape measure protein n=1 Tax=Andreprevotia sp. IGB-42 TaxID=2497473 RepID=UPI001358BFA0|nr:tape measure protein [Andreprevotia sp. IGB-42]KAF0812787.1 hypothetical protein IGB42_02630 [Andreprevotia sp. IGB-42]